MALEVYWGSGSPYAWAVLLTLEVKKLPYESHLLEFSKKQHKTPEFLAINPRGKVPAIKDGAVTLSESLAIMVYLDQKSPQRPLFGVTPVERGRIMQGVSEILSYLQRPLLEAVRPIFDGMKAGKEEKFAKNVDAIHREWKIINERLAKTPWLCGAEMSGADLLLYPFVKLFLRACGKEAAQALSMGFLPLGKTYPHIQKWLERVEALPGYEKAYPPHWR